jgi:hypothetical protein
MTDFSTKYKLYFKQDICLINSKKIENPFYFKLTNKKFGCANYNDWIKQYKQYIESGSRNEFYENIPFQPKQGLPLYFDIEWTSYDDSDVTPLSDFIYLFESYCKSKHPNSILSKGPLVFAQSRATRTICSQDQLYNKHSYHLILREPKIHFINQLSIKNFIKDFLSWTHLSLNKTIISKRSNLSISKIGEVNKVDNIPDISVYNSNSSTYKAYRLPFAIKSSCQLTKSILIPQNYTDSIENHFVRHVDKDSNLYQPIVSEVLLPKFIVNSRVQLCPTENKIPLHISKTADKYYFSKHPKGKRIRTESSSTGYKIFYVDSHSNCCCCQKIHSERDNLFWTNMISYNFIGHVYIYHCRNISEYGFKLNNLHQPEITNWDYEYSDRVNINCDPLRLDNIQEHGTFLLQAPKGSGKSEAIVEFVRNLPENVSILYPSFRINLCEKNLAELKDFGFSDYRSKQFNPHRAIVCLPSITKCINNKYDIIIIDEIYSVFEAFSSPLMNNTKQIVMKTFEKLVKDATRVYCLDAHLDCGLVVKPLHKLRSVEGFIYHKNPQSHDYSNYNVYYDEYIRDDWSDKSIVNQNNRLIKDLGAGKKIGVMCSSKNTTIKIAKMVQDLQNENKLPNFKILLYNADTDSDSKKKDFSDTTKSWGNGDVKLIIYSPTVSAGISYNDNTLSGVHNLYCYIMGGTSLPSFNTTRQMFFRIRQLLDKNIYIMAYRRCPNNGLKESDIETNLRKNITSISKSIGTPFLNNFTFDDEWNPIFDSQTWDYQLWLETNKEEIKYNSVGKIKEGIKKEFSNPIDDIEYPGRGMRWFDMTLNNVMPTKVNTDVISTDVISDDVISTDVISTDVREESEEIKFTDIPSIDYKKWFSYSKRIKNDENPLSSEELYCYKRKILCDRFDIDLDYIQKNKLCVNSNPPEFSRDTELLEKIKLFLENDNPTTSEIYIHQKTYLNSYNIDGLRRGVQQDTYKHFNVGDYLSKTITKYVKEKLGEFFNKKMTTPQIIDGLILKNYHKITALHNLLEFVNIPRFEDLSNYKIETELLTNALKKDDFIKTLNPISDDIQGRFKHEASYKQALLKMKLFYKKNPDKIFYDLENRDNLIKSYKLNKTFYEFSKKRFEIMDKLHKNAKRHDKFKEEILSGEWCPTAWKTYRIDRYDEKDLLRLIKRAVNHIGYDISSESNSTKKQKVTKWKFTNRYEYLKSIQSDCLLNREEKELRKENNYTDYKLHTENKFDKIEEEYLNV